MNPLKITLSLSIFAATLLFQASCSKSQKEPANVITDGKGLSIDLKWTTSNNIPTALTEADLDLDVLNDSGEILSSYNKNDFEHIDLTSILADGTYTIKVSLYEIFRKSQYTLSITGAGCGKSFNISGILKDGVKPTIAVLKIVKSGDKFTLASL